MPPRHRPTPPPPMPAAALDDHRRRLVALRDHLTAQLEAASERNIAAIARQLQSVLDALSKLPLPDGDSVIDRLQARRRARFEASGIPEPPARARRPMPTDSGRLDDGEEEL